MIAKVKKQNPRVTIRRNKILVADDDPAILDALKMILEISDYEVQTIKNGSILPTVKKDKPQLLLLDIWLSGLDGRDICKKLKAKEETKDIPVILISASHDVEKSSKAAGANDFIAKPFEMNELLTKVEKYLTN